MILVIAKVVVLSALPLKVIHNEYSVLIGQFLLLRRNFIGEWLWCSESNHFGVRITLALPVPTFCPRILKLYFFYSCTAFELSHQLFGKPFFRRRFRRVALMRRLRRLPELPRTLPRRHSPAPPFTQQCASSFIPDFRIVRQTFFDQTLSASPCFVVFAIVREIFHTASLYAAV